MKFFPRNHVYRNYKNAFNSVQERNLTPQCLIRKEILQTVFKLQYKLGKKIQIGKKRKKKKTE